MRPPEILLVLANLTMMIALVVVRTPQSWLCYLAPIPFLIAAVQAVAEGQRWQLWPAYASVGTVWKYPDVASLNMSGELMRLSGRRPLHNESNQLITTAGP